MTNVKLCMMGMILLVSAGCATRELSHAEIRELASEVHVIDGVDKVEAILIAQNFLLRRGIYDRLTKLEPYRVTYRELMFEDDKPIEYAIIPRDRTNVRVEAVWEILFKDKKYTVLKFFPVVPFRVVVDAHTGKIVTWGIDRLGDEHDIERTRTDSKVTDPDEPYYKTLKDVEMDLNQEDGKL